MNAKGLPSQRATARRWQLAATAVVAALAIAGCKRADENKPAETQAPAAPAAQAPAPAPAAPPPVTSTTPAPTTPVPATAPAQGASPVAAAPAGARSGKPNIVVIFGDDVGLGNVSAFSHGVVGYKTPNIDRIAKEGMMLTDYYAENSCTAGRSTFITGQTVFRTGLSKVGLPGAPVGLQDRDITIAQALKPLGYNTAQFGKNHLGDQDRFLPTKHGFDEFFGNLYHLNAEEEPERPYWPKDNPDFLKYYNPRGVIHSTADGKIEDTGPLNRKRMETIDDETTGAAIQYIQKQAQGDKPFFLWMNFTRMHLFTHVRPEYRGKAGLGGGHEYADGMWEMDQNVGKLLKSIDDAGITNNTIVVYTTDNGPNFFTWPDAANTPFRSEKDSNWEGAYRVPAMIRWPGKIQPGTVSNGLMSGLDWFPTLLAAAGDGDVKDRLVKGTTLGGKSAKVHLDGYNQLPMLTGQTEKSARNEFFYFNDDAELVAMRYDVLTQGATQPTAWKVVFCEQRARGGFEVWKEPFTCLRAPKYFNLRMDPYERADTGPTNLYHQLETENPYLFIEGNRRAIQFLQTFVDYPPSQLPASFTIDQAEASVKRKVAEQMAKAQSVQPQKK
ncbi:arylsulfatase [Cupriavidus sp. OV038]|jgi:arylsulfatase|uniref:arylsulfatase n=1 Tax=unclassified Cupriavidus TaxID=2640874 RepID=UPI0008E5E13C|nr:MULTISPECIES: arylsulfatase [unclassified Cupriavidus]SFC90794.1 arylsulfatase [Cupriavidus sp. OV038]SFP55062.1 arylsulfatase [Cupriavidus sp. OV096]